jgi:hypothetical protein
LSGQFFEVPNKKKNLVPQAFFDRPSIGPVAVARTGGILPAADLDELLDIGDFARHGDGLMLMRCDKRGKVAVLADVVWINRIRVSAPGSPVSHVGMWRLQSG